jgi:hypothetical protein
VEFNKKEIFWENNRRDHANGNLDCYEGRLEEIVNSCTYISRKYWKNQKGIAPRSRRTQLFLANIFRYRKSQKCDGSEIFGNRQGSFAMKVLSYVRNPIISQAGNQIEGRDWEEALIYAMARNGDFFGTAMMKFNEKQIYKKFFKVVDILQIARLDDELMLDFKFYAKFLALYVTKMKRDSTKIDEEMSGKGMKKAQLDYYNHNIEKWSKNTKKVKEHPECDYSVDNGMCLTDKAYFRDSEKSRYQKKRKKRYKQLWNNCILLTNYKGKMFINQEYVLSRRKIRYEEERQLIKKFCLDQTNQNEEFRQTVYNDHTLKSFYGKPYERKLDILDCEYKEPTIDQLSTVDELGKAVEEDNLFSPQILR